MFAARKTLNSQLSIFNSKGFTLIELLVVVSMMTALLAIGVAYYSGFSQNATLDGAAKELRANLRLAQAFAVNGEKIPTSCVSGTYTFNGYYVVLQNNATSYQLGQYCSLTASPFTDQITARTPPSPIKLPTGVTLTGLTNSTTTILFQSVRGAKFYNCSPAPCFTSAFSGPVTVNVTSGTNKTLTITSDGKIQ